MRVHIVLRLEEHETGGCFEFALLSQLENGRECRVHR